MSSRESVIYIKGIGDSPIEQFELPEIWKPFELNLEFQPIDWTDTNYEERLRNIGDRARQLSKIGRVSLMGASAGGKAVLSIFARHQDNIHRAVIISGKINPYIISTTTRDAFPNLVISSDILALDLEYIGNSMRRRILCVHPLSDKVVAPEDAVLEGAHSHTVQADGHIEGVAHALINDGNVIADFIHQD